jgi:oligopeptide/dipeptide ABC transporter ATP-binding protein
MRQVQMPALLEVRDLRVRYAAARAAPPALNGVTFDVKQGEVVGVLGESGSGKTTLALAILRLLPPGGSMLGGSIRFRNRDVSALSESELQAFRGLEVSMIFQEPDLALNPFLRALDQVEEVIRAHRPWKRAQRQEQARWALRQVGMDKSPPLFSAYPHQLSGGERQRLVIAQAIGCQPALLIADEPTASLDAVLQCEWVELMQRLRGSLGLALLLIVHDPLVLAGLADRVLVMYGGQIVEEGTTEQVLRQPLHPYTQALLQSIPPVPGTVALKKRLPVITRPEPPGVARNEGCPFEPRCPDRMAECSVRPPPEAVMDGSRRLRCFRYGE